MQLLYQWKRRSMGFRVGMDKWLIFGAFDCLGAFGLVGGDRM